MFNEKFKAKSLLGDKPILVIEPNANYRMTMKGFLQNFGIKTLNSHILVRKQKTYF